jgi:hypothetical protein
MDLQFPHILRPFQLEPVQASLEGLKRNGSWLLGARTGWGKTYGSLAIAKELGLDVVVICPKKIKIDWTRAGYDVGVEVESFGWEEMKTGKTKYGKWEEVGNFEWHIPQGKLLVFDELHRAKNHNTKNGRMVSAAARQNIVSLGLSATIGKNPIHLSSIGRWLKLHKGGPDFFRWAAERGVSRNRGEFVFDGDESKVKDLHNHIFPSRGIRPGGGADIQEDVIICEPVDFDSAKQINATYKELKAKIQEINLTADKAARRGYILAAQTAARRSVELYKAPAIAEMVIDLIEEGNSVFLAVNYRETLFWLADKLNTRCMVYGQGQSEDEARGSIDSFQRNSSKLILGTIGAVKESISLHDKHGGHPRVALFMPMFSAFDFSQIIGRISRSGNQSPTIQKMLYAAGVPIEEKVCYVLNKSYRELSILNDGMVDPMVSLIAA